MKKLNFKNSLGLIVVIILTVGISVSFQSIFAIWQAPTNSPPGGNLEKPINEGTTEQTKAGGFGVGEDFLVGTDVFFVDESSGKVGIGITNPAMDLHIAGNTANMQLGGSPDTNAENSDGDIHILDEDDNIVVQIEGADTVTALTDPNSGVYISGKGNSFFNAGKVGIGIANPQEDLHIGGGGEIRLESSSVGITFIDNSIGDGDFRIKASLGQIRFDSDGDSDDNWDNRISILANGKVGIGIANPQEDLHIGGGGEIRLEANSAGVAFIDNTIGECDFRIKGSSNKLQFDSDGDSDDNWDHRMYMLPSGDFGIGREPSSNKLEVEGDASKTVAGDWLSNSDMRIKTNIIDSEGLDLLNLLRPVKFKYTEEYKNNHSSIDDKFYYNFIAQEFAEVFPESVKGSGEFLSNKEEILQLDAHNANIIAIKAIQELSVKIKELENRIKELEIK